MSTSPTFIPGYKGTLMVNAEDLSAIVSNVSLTLTRNVLNKPTMGQAWGYALSGQRTGALSYQGHLSAEQAADLQAIFDIDAPVDFSFQMGDGAGATDAGVYTGECVITQLGHEAAADGEYDWTLEATTTGPVTYAPPTP